MMTTSTPRESFERCRACGRYLDAPAVLPRLCANCKLVLASHPRPADLKALYTYSLSLEVRSYVIGICGKARHGKDTLASYVLRYLPPGMGRIYCFAGALKTLARFFGLSPEGEKDARLLQLLGTDIARSRDEGIWLRQLILQLIEEKPPVALIPDVRFRNEFEFCRDHGMVVRVIRKEPGGKEFVAGDRDPFHPSETGAHLPEADITITATSGDLAALDEWAKTIAVGVAAMAKGAP